MTDEELKAVEQRGYARGYAAGRRKLESDADKQARYAQRQDFLDSAFIASLPACIAAQGWKRGEESILSLQDRVALAWDVAEAALKQRRYA